MKKVSNHQCWGRALAFLLSFLVAISSFNGAQASLVVPHSPAQSDPYTGPLEDLEFAKKIERHRDVDALKRSLPQKVSFLYGFRAAKAITLAATLAAFGGVTSLAGHHYLVNVLLPALEDPGLMTTAELLGATAVNAGGIVLGVVATAFGYEVADLFVQTAIIRAFSKTEDATLVDKLSMTEDATLVDRLQSVEDATLVDRVQSTKVEDATLVDKLQSSKVEDATLVDKLQATHTEDATLVDRLQSTKVEEATLVDKIPDSESATLVDKIRDATLVDRLPDED